MFGNPTAGHQVLRNMGLAVLFVVFNNAMWEEVERAALAFSPRARLRGATACRWRPWATTRITSI